MKQRAALLRTYMLEKEIILLDEPFSSLDAITRREMHKWYLEILENHKKSTIFITHDIDEAILLANRIYILGGSPGEIIGEMKIEGLKNENFTLSNEFVNYKQEILDVMKK